MIAKVSFQSSKKLFEFLRLNKIEDIRVVDVTLMYNTFQEED